LAWVALSVLADYPFAVADRKIALALVEAL